MSKTVTKMHCQFCDVDSWFIWIGSCLEIEKWWRYILIKLHLMKRRKFTPLENWMCPICRGMKLKVADT